MKRFTATEKWDDPWFRMLPPELKCFWAYLLDKCDQAGVWEADWAAASFFVGADLNSAKVLKAFAERIEVLSGGPVEKWRVIKFVVFQYPKLSRDCKPHAPVFVAVDKHGLQLDKVASGARCSVAHEKVFNTLQEGLPNLQYKDKDTDTDKDPDTEGKPLEVSRDSDNPHGKLPEQLRAEKLFRRRPTTPWDAACKKAWDRSKAAIMATTEAEWVLLEWFYSIPPEGTYRRHDLGTLLNNWSAEIDRAQNHKNTAKPNGNHATMLPKNVREAMETKAT
jgi:hypothetical protein